MIEWLITDYHFITTSFFTCIIFFAVILSAIMSRSAYANSFKLSDFAVIALLNLVMSIVTTFVISMTILMFTSTRPVGSSEWKTIYDSTGSAAKTEIAKSLSEDQKSSELAASSITSNLSDAESNGVKIKISYRMSSVEAGNEIGERFADVFSNLTDHQSKTVSINASKSEYAKSKDFELSKDNIVSNGDIDKSSKIVKVEIRSADYVETEFFGFKGSNRYLKSDEVRITLGNDTKVQKEVNEIFE